MPDFASLSLIDQPAHPAARKLLPLAFVKSHGVLLDCLNEVRPQLLYHRAPALHTYLEVQRLVGQKNWQQVSEQEFAARLVKNYETASSEAMQMFDGIEDNLDLYQAAEHLEKSQDLLEAADDAPIIRLINAILSEAIKAGASDVHLETYEENLSVRFRIDGVLQKIIEPKRLLAPLLVARIKVMSKLDIAEKRVPQDGRLSLRIGGRALDVRVSTMPASHGERVVLRLLEKNDALLSLASLGLSQASHQALRGLIAKPHGIILVTGPTGSGKTTTLYAALTELNEATRNILTVEDPIEYDLPGVGQTQVNTKVNMTFAKGLRAILRQDPDVVMIGEIRDYETAEIAVQASLTGHLVLSTLHTNTAAGAITRLQDIGVERFLLATSLSGIIAQRLVRVLCANCKESYQAADVDKHLLDQAGSATLTLYRPKGCAECNHVGYRGRIGIYEILVVDEEIRHLITTGASEMVIERHSRQSQRSMRLDGVTRVCRGETSLEELVRVTIQD